MAKSEPAQLHGEIDRTFKEIGAAMNLTEHRTRMIYLSAMRKIRLHHCARLAQMRELARGKHVKYGILHP
jgi:DNA-directed RNA polymerase sigma subunit (sigma70/sigma32)